MTHSYFISHKAISNCMLYVCVMKSSANCYYKISAENWRGRKTTVRNWVITHKGEGQNHVSFPLSSTGHFSRQSQAFPSHSHSNLQAVRQSPSFTLRWAESTLAAKYTRDVVWLCLSSYLCSISLMSKPTLPCVTAVSYQTGRSCPLPGVPVVMALSGKFYASLKGNMVRENTFCLGKTQLMHCPGNFSHFCVGLCQKHMDFQFCSASSSICLRDLLQSTAIAKRFRQS